MIQINWRPNSGEIRRWGMVMLLGTSLGGCVLEFLLGHSGAARVLWVFGGLSFLTGMAGRPVGLPLYLFWMSLVWLVSSTIATVALALVFYFVVTPIGWTARLAGRDRLRLRRPDPETLSLWEPAQPSRLDRFDRPF